MIIGQITTLITKNGRVDHEVGSHDDMVVGWLLGQWFLRKGKNLSYYGIEGGRAMSALRTKEPDSLLDSIEREEQLRIRGRIEEIYESLKQCDDEYVVQKLEHELRVLDRKIILQNDEIYSLDELIRSVRETRRKARMSRGPSPDDYSSMMPPVATGQVVVSARPPTGRQLYGY